MSSEDGLEESQTEVLKNLLREALSLGFSDHDGVLYKGIHCELCDFVQKLKNYGIELVDETEEEDPLLGLATTKQLLDELICRMEITADGNFEELLHSMIFGSLCRAALEKLSPTILAYRTVDGS